MVVYGKWVNNRVAYTGFMLQCLWEVQMIEGGSGGSGGSTDSDNHGRNQSTHGKEYPIKRSGIVDIWTLKGNWGSDGWSNGRH